MVVETMRVRLVFEDGRVLNKSQKKEGLDRSWVVLKPQEHSTISDFSSHLLRIFDLYDTCPTGVVLSMDGFILPPFESTSILKDKDTVSVKKKRSSLSEIVKGDDEGDAFEEIEAPERQLVIPGLKLLANEEFSKEIEGYESELEEYEPELMEDALWVDCTPPRKSSSKKRKASSKCLSSKRKKSKLASAEESPKEAVNNVHGSKKKKSCGDMDAKKTPDKKKRASDVQKEQEKTCMTTTADERDNDIDKCAPSSKRSSQPEGSKGTRDLSQMSGETKKTPSRSARRKKAKRRWLREKAKLEKEEKQSIVKGTQQSLDNVVEEHQNDVEENCKVVEEHQDDMGDEVVPVEIRPGHIRFEPLVGEDQPICKSEAPMETFQWNGITSKRKGQKWGKERTAYSRWHDQSFSQDISQTQTANVHLDYEQLMPYIGLPKEGDVVAYRLIELSSSWTPEISSFRVGKISQYNSISKKVVLVPVHEYPVEKKKVDEDDSSTQPDTSLYNEDGSLEIEFSSLLDVRTVKNGTFDIARVITNEVSEQAAPESNEKSASLSLSNNIEAHNPAKVNGSVNVWEEITQALNAKKAELSHEDGWSKKKNSIRGPWSYKALKGSALGPTMDYLRSKKEL